MLFCSLSKERGVRFVHRRRKTAGFTLIELLVVVLIIGILSAVALPRYQTAVKKARMSEVFVILKKIQREADVLALANGVSEVHKFSMEELSEIPEMKNGEYNDVLYSWYTPGVDPTGWAIEARYLEARQRWRNTGMGIGAVFKYLYV